MKKWLPLKITLRVFLLLGALVMIIVRDRPIRYSFTWDNNGDIEIIRNRMVAELQDSEIDPSELLTDLQSNGSFSSVDYYSERRDTWYPAQHLTNILTMSTAAYSLGNPYYKNPQLIEGINRAIGFWVEKDFTCDWNDWWNDLGTGPLIGDILLYPHNDVDPSYVDWLVEKLKGISIFHIKKKWNVYEREVNATGGNLTDAVNHSLKYAVIVEDGEAIRFLQSLMENELRPFPSTGFLQKRWDSSGIKADMSFHQHFELLYMGGYGEVFLEGVNRYIGYSNETQFALSQRALELYQDFLLDGMQFAMRGEYRDMNASGRGIARVGGSIGIADKVQEAVTTLLSTGVKLSRSSELEGLALRSTLPDPGAGGHRYFWNSDYQVMNNKNYMATVRGASKRTKNSEALNGENVLGHYLGAGATFYYLEGNEYEDIYPLWDWNRVPGTTALQGALPVGSINNTYTRMGKTSFVGGLSQGEIGMGSMEYRDNKVRAKKSWFMFANGVVALGADISSSASGEVITTINQTLEREEVQYSLQGERGKGSNLELIETFDWVYHKGIAYISNGAIGLQSGVRSGDWKDISTRKPLTPHTDTVLELGISHGVEPKSGGYEYTLLFNRTLDASFLGELDRYVEDPTYQVVVNSGEVQAVWDKESSTFMAVFWKKGELIMPNNLRLAVNRGCNIMVQPSSNQEGYTVYVSDPTQRGGSVEITLGNQQSTVNFEGGEYAGKTYSLSMSR